MKLTETARMVLVRAEVFMDLATDNLASIRRYLEEQHLSAGQALFREGNEGDKLYVIRRGTVRLQRIRDGVLYEIGQLGPSELVGETALIDSSPRSVAAVCVTDCDLFVLSREAFYEILSKYPGIATKMLRVLTERIRVIDSVRVQELEEKNLALEQARDRLTQLLAHMESTNDQLETALSSRDCFLSVAPYPAVLTDTENNVRLTNPAALRLFGESKSRTIWEWIRPGTPYAVSMVEETLGRNTTWSGELDLYAMDERVLLCNVVAVPIGNSGGGEAARLWIIEDRTECRAVEEQASQHERLATKCEMAAEIAHELNNYLAVLSGNTELLEMHLTAARPEKAGRCLANIRQSLDRIRVFTDNMLNSRQPDGQRLAMDINSFLDNQISFLKPQRKFKKVVFNTIWGTNIPPIVCDPSAIQQVFYNLVLNAAEALAETAGEHSTICVSTEFVPEQNLVRLHVSDDGPGIAPKLAGALFRQHVSSKPTGHGFGLLTVQRIATEHGGRASAGPRDGGGTEFTIELPAGAEPPVP